MIELSILKEFISICQEHKLRYYAIGGTALGALRHQGFIPWDDDIDVSMPRDDYNKFYEIVSKRGNDFYGVTTIETQENQMPPIIKFIDKRITIFSKLDTKTKHRLNPYIDIFPMDGLPNNRILRYFHVRRFLVYRRFLLFSAFDRLVERGIKNKALPLHKRFFVWFFDKINIQRFFSRKRMAFKGDKVLKKYNFYKQNFCSPQLWGNYKTKAVFPSEWFDDGKFLLFEDVQVLVPSHIEKYLGQLYGSDYMELPPVSKRISHSWEIEMEGDACDDEI